MLQLLQGVEDLFLRLTPERVVKSFRSFSDVAVQMEANLLKSLELKDITDHIDDVSYRLLFPKSQCFQIVYESILSLWGDKVIKEAYARRSEFQLNDSAA